IARIVNSATMETSVRGFVEAAVARGESIRYLLGREIFPNIIGTIAADAGPRVTVSIFLIAGLNFLGLGIQPPAADWALMITENRQAISIQPWGVALPVNLLAAVTLARHLPRDAIARAYGRMLDGGEAARRGAPSSSRRSSTSEARRPRARRSARTFPSRSPPAKCSGWSVSRAAARRRRRSRCSDSPPAASASPRAASRSRESSSSG